MFAKLVKCVLAPLLSGAVVDDQVTSIDPAADTVTHDPTTNTLSLSPAKGSKKTLHIYRKQRFHRTELALARSFVRASTLVRGAHGQPFEKDVLRHFPERVITMAVAEEARRTAMGILSKFDEWASSSYEGKRVSATVGIQCEPKTTVSGMLDVKLSELLTEPYAPILTNGLDTMLVVSSDGVVQSIEAVDATKSVPFAPLRYAGVAEWSDGSNCALSLSNSGDVLLFVNGALCFARRRTSWHHYTHEVVLEHLDSLDEIVQTAVYETLLDASFAGSGACIAIVPDDSGMCQ